MPCLIKDSADTGLGEWLREFSTCCTAGRPEFESPGSTSKVGTGHTPVNPGLGSWTQGDPVAHWSASQPWRIAPGSVRDLFSKTKVKSNGEKYLTSISTRCWPLAAIDSCTGENTLYVGVSANTTTSRVTIHMRWEGNLVQQNSEPGFGSNFLNLSEPNFGSNFLNLTLGSLF